MRNLLERVAERFPEREGFKVTDTLVNEIKSDLKVFKANPVKVAAKLGVPTSMVRFIMNETPNPHTSFTRKSEDGWGDEKLRSHIVARTVAGDGWPDEKKAEIEDARRAYDAGEVELAQGRDGDFVILYAIPRKRKARRDYAYFASMEPVHDE